MVVPSVRDIWGCRKGKVGTTVKTPQRKHNIFYELAWVVVSFRRLLANLKNYPVDDEYVDDIY